MLFRSRLSSEEAAALADNSGANGRVVVSALVGTGLEELLRCIDQAMPVDRVVRLQLRVPLADGRTLALVHALGRVLRSEVCDTQMAIEAELPESVARRLKLDFTTSPA